MHWRSVTRKQIEHALGLYCGVTGCLVIALVVANAAAKIMLAGAA